MAKQSSKGEKVRNGMRGNPTVRPGAGDPVCISTRELFRACREVLIEHHGETYRLRVTKNGKLILTK